MTLTVQREQTPCMIEVRMVAHCGKEIQNLPIICGRVTNSVCRQQRQLQRMGNPNRCLVSPFFFPFAMAVQLDVNGLTTEDANQFPYSPSDGFFAARRPVRT